MSLNRFFLLFLLSSLIIYYGIEPYLIDQKKLKDIPQLEFKTFISYEIEDESLKMMMVGEEAQRFTKRFQIKDFAIYRELNNSIEVISANNGMYRKKSIALSESVQYQGKDALFLKTEKAHFDMQNNRLNINAPFVLTQKGSVLRGGSLLFNQNNDRITIKDVNASFTIK